MYAIATCFITQGSNDSAEYTVYMELNSTLCKQNARANMSTNYCNIRYNLNYKVVDVVSSLTSLIITIGVIVLASTIFCIMLLSAKRMKERKQQEIQELE